MKNLVLLLFAGAIIFFSYKYYTDSQEVTETLTVRRLMVLKEAQEKRLRSRKTGRVKVVKIPAVKKEYTETVSFKYSKGADEKTIASKKKMAEKRALNLIKYRVEDDKRKGQRLTDEQKREVERLAALDSKKKANIALRKKAVAFYKEVIPILNIRSANFGGNMDFHSRCAKMKSAVSSAIKRKSFLSQADDIKLYQLIADINASATRAARKTGRLDAKQVKEYADKVQDVYLKSGNFSSYDSSSYKYVRRQYDELTQ